MSVVAGLRRPVPTICGVCARLSYSVAYTARPRKGFEQSVMWVCRACVPHARKVYEMNPEKLDHWEESSIADAIKDVQEPIVSDILTAFYETVGPDGTIGSVNKDVFDRILERLHLSGALQDRQRSFLTAYEAAMRARAEGEATPF